MPHRHCIRPVVIVLTAALASACGVHGSSGSSSSSGSTSTSTHSTSTSAGSNGSNTTTTGGTGTPLSISATPTTQLGCRSGPRPPAGAHRRSVEDVDGDGRRDTAWVSAPGPATTFGITTAAGGGATVAYPSASPIARSALVVNVDERGPVEMILTDGRSASLYAFSDCAIRPVRNVQGRDYEFDLGDRIGTGSGVGCVQTAAGRRLVGLNEKPNADGSIVVWSRTVINLNGLQARNGATSHGTFHSPADDARIALLDQITCGDLTMQRDGVSDQSG